MNVRAVIYARYSSDNQSPRSIEDQIALCRSHAAQGGIEIVGVYSDAAISGFGRESRPGYMKLVADACSRDGRDWSVILVEDISRLTRDLGELLRLYQRLRFRGVDIIGVSDGISTAAKSAELNLTLKGFVNSVYRRDLSEKTHRGMAAAFERGCSPGGRVYGYRTVSSADGGARRTTAARYEIVKSEAAIVQRIFQEYVAGRSLKRIAYALNADGVPHPAAGTGKERLRAGWGTSTIHWILRNERYIGRLRWNRTSFLADPESGLRRPRTRPEGEWMSIEAPELRIISEELWGAVLDRRETLAKRAGSNLSDRLAAGRAATSKYLLSGLLRCGICGGRMAGTTTTRIHGDRTYKQGWYRCSMAVSRGPTVCGHRVGYRREVLENTVLEEFRRATVEQAEAIAAMINERIAATAKAQGDRPNAIAAELTGLRVAARNLARFIAEGNDSRTVREELTATEALITALEAEAVSLTNRAAPQVPWVHPELVRQRLGDLLGLLKRDPVRAKAVVARHLESDLRIVPQPAPAGERLALIEGACRLLRGRDLICGRPSP